MNAPRRYTFVNPSYKRPNQTNSYMLGEHDGYLASEVDPILAAGQLSSDVIGMLRAELRERYGEECTFFDDAVHHVLARLEAERDRLRSFYDIEHERCLELKADTIRLAALLRQAREVLKRQVHTGACPRGAVDGGAEVEFGQKCECGREATLAAIDAELEGGGKQ